MEQLRTRPALRSYQFPILLPAPSLPSPMRSRRVLILGAGFAGIAAAKALKHFDGEVVVIDRTKHHLFQPLLYQVAAAGLSASDIAQPVRTLLRGQRNARIHMAAVEHIDLASREVTLSANEGRLPYDFLIIALGVQTSYFGRDEWSQHALGLKTLADAHRIRDRILSSYERAENTHADPALRQKLLTTVVIGAGPTGVEMAGSYAELARRTLRPEFRLANLSDARVILLDAGSRVLPSFPESLSARAASSPNPADTLSAQLPLFLPDGPVLLAAQSAISAARANTSPADFAASISCPRAISGYVLHTLPAVLFFWLSSPLNPRAAIESAIRRGGDTDTIAALVGGLSALSSGPQSLPQDWLNGIVDFPLNPHALTILESRNLPASRWLALPFRNLFFLLVVLAHAARRLLPPYA